MILAESLLENMASSSRSNCESLLLASVGVGGTPFLPSSCGNRDNPVGSQQRLCQSTNVSLPSCRFHVWPNVPIISRELSTIFLTLLPRGALNAASTLFFVTGGGCRSLCIKPWRRNNGSLAWMAPGKAICQGERAAPLSAIVECGGRLMRAA